MWSDAARKAAAAARKAKGGKTTAAQYRAHGAATKAKRQARQMPGGMQNFPTKGVPKGTAAYKRKTQPHKVLPNTPVVHKLAAPMPQPGVAKPTGPHAFSDHVANNPNNPKKSKDPVGQMLKAHNTSPRAKQLNKQAKSAIRKVIKKKGK